jgi:rod shape determining protein RodA
MLNPMEDPLGDGYHTIQGTICHRLRWIAGQGFGWQETQTHLDFIPERTTDFIFAVFAEEFGLIGNVLLLILYLLTIGRGLFIASKASGLFGRLLAGSIALSFFTYAFCQYRYGVRHSSGGWVFPLPLISLRWHCTRLLCCLDSAFLMSIHAHRKTGA